MADNKNNNGEDEFENVRVAIRVRPLSKKEETQGKENIISVDREENLISLTKPNLENEKPKSFKFDHIFADDCTQMDVYRNVAFPIVEKVLRGYNGTIFAYGQTGTGKTYTMTGNKKSAESKGIIPNTFSQIFSQISRCTGEKSFVVIVTYLEIYNEDVRDLLSLNHNAKLLVRERPEVGVYVKDLMGFTVDSIESITELMNRGNTNRTTRSTLMNDVSSRSHAIFTITIESKDRIDNKTTIAKLNLVDLAGSERLSRTRATGKRLKESSNINQSLSVLGNVISALIDGRSTHIPYRNSKLTRLLQDSLGGNSKTVMIATVSPSDVDFEESICTLRYASRVKYIKNKVKVNVETKKGMIENFEQEIARLQRKISIISLYEKKFGTLKKRDESQFDAITEEEIETTSKVKEELLQKISLMQKKILVGGENLFEKAQQQMFLLQTSGAELETLNKSHQQLEEQIQQKGAEKIDVTEKYSSLQEEEAGVTKMITKIQSLLKDIKEEHADKEHEYQREMEALLDNYRLLIREVQLADLMMENYISKEYSKKVEMNTAWNTETTEFQMKGVGYTGNNRRRHTFGGLLEPCNEIKRGIKMVYRSYVTKKFDRARPRSNGPRPSGRLIPTKDSMSRHSIN